MSTDPNRLEVERIRNLVTGFGWELVKEEIDDVHINITMRKLRVLPVVEAGASAD